MPPPPLVSFELLLYYFLAHWLAAPLSLSVPGFIEFLRSSVRSVKEEIEEMVYFDSSYLIIILQSVVAQNSISFYSFWLLMLDFITSERRLWDLRSTYVVAPCEFCLCMRIHDSSELMMFLFWQISLRSCSQFRLNPDPLSCERRVLCTESVTRFCSCHAQLFQKPWSSF